MNSDLVNPVIVYKVPCGNGRISILRVAINLSTTVSPRALKSLRQMIMIAQQDGGSTRNSIRGESSPKAKRTPHAPLSNLVTEIQSCRLTTLRRSPYRAIVIVAPLVAPCTFRTTLCFSRVHTLVTFVADLLRNPVQLPHTRPGKP